MVNYYLLGALAMLGIAWWVAWWPLTIIMGWGALSLLCVSFAYIFNYPSIFRKRDDGSIPFYIRWLFFPFLLITGGYNHVARKCDSVPAIQKVDDNLYLACRLSNRDVAKLKQDNIEAILDVTAEFDGLDWSAQQHEMEYVNIPVLDHTSSTNEQMVMAINWISQQIAQNKRVVVHCALGRGRSFMMVAAYLLSRSPDKSIEAVIARVQAIRKTARLNKQQTKGLTAFHQQNVMASLPRLSLIANPVAGAGKWSKHKKTILAQLNPYFNVSIYETSESEDGAVMAQKAMQQDMDIVVACGGDGTVGEVAGIIKQTDATLGIVPLGTANSLSQVFHGMGSRIMPITQACRVIRQGITRTIDTALCNGQIMLLTFALGFEQKMIEKADRDEKNKSGQLAYLQSLWDAMSENEPHCFEVTFDDEKPQSMTTASFVIANAAPVTTALAQGRNMPSATDGKLDVTWLAYDSNEVQPFVSLAELVFKSDEGKYASERIHHRHVQKVRIAFDSSVAYAIDGEIRHSEEVKIECLPDSLKVLTQKDSPAC